MIISLSGLSDVALDVVNDPDEIAEGSKKELIAVKRFKNKYLIVIYREVTTEDGFIITAFITTRIDKIRQRRRTLWKKE